MSAHMEGLDEYGGGKRRVTLGREGPHVKLSVEATSGSNVGEALLTPEQARALGEGLRQQAKHAENASDLSGTFDLPGGEASI